MFCYVTQSTHKTKGLFCLPECGSYDTDVTIHLSIPEPTIYTKERLAPLNFSILFTLRSVHSVSNTGLTLLTAKTLKQPY